MSLLASIVLASLGATSTTLYDGVSNLLPNQSPWTWGYAGVGAVVLPPNGTQRTTLDTTSNRSVQAGWLTVSLTPLDPSRGYVVTFDLRLLSESHVTNDRSGLSVIVIGTDKKGLELGFWTDRVWAQADDPLFTHAEEALVDTTANGAGRAGLRRYRLHFFGSQYVLSVDGRPVLSGARRDYSAFAGFPDPYEIPNALFVGDDTTSAQARFEWSLCGVESPAGRPPFPVRSRITRF